MPAKNLKEFIDYLTANSSKMTYGHAGVGSIAHVSGLVFNSKFGFKPTLVPYRGTGPALKDRGDGELWRHSRLRWLNSTIGIDDEPTAGYPPLEVQGQTVRRDLGAGMGGRTPGSRRHEFSGRAPCGQDAGPRIR